MLQTQGSALWATAAVCVTDMSCAETLRCHAAALTSWLCHNVAMRMCPHTFLALLSARSQALWQCLATSRRCPWTLQQG